MGTLFPLIFNKQNPRRGRGLTQFVGFHRQGFDSYIIINC